MPVNDVTYIQLGCMSSSEKVSVLLGRTLSYSRIVAVFNPKCSMWSYVWLNLHV